MSLNDFEFGIELGKGAFGSVSIVKRKEDQQTYAMKRVKIINLPKKEKDNSFNEVRLLASLRHKNIIGYKEAFYDEKSSTLNIVMEYADDGDLSSKIKYMLKKHLQFEEKSIWSILIQILEGIDYLHKSKIIHRDLKSANIFLTKKGIVKIGDLNVSIIAKKNLAVTQTGTPYYAAPEVWENESYNNKCDIWSIGCIIYEMAALHVPFRGTSIHQLYKNIMKGKYTEIPNIYSNDLKNIIKTILCLDPLKRPSANDLLNNEIIKNKIKEIGLSNGKLKEKAMLMKTIKIPKNISQINLQLPKKQYSKEKNLEEMMENDEYETAKQTFYRPESADKIKHTEKKFVFDNIEFGRNNPFNINDDYKKMKTLNEKQIVDNLLKEKNKKNNKNDINNKLNKDNNESNITNLDENISLNNEDEKNNEDVEFKKTLFNSSIPEYIQGTPIIKNEDIKRQREESNNENEEIIEKNTRKFSYEEKKGNKFSNIDYIFDETNKNKEKEKDNVVLEDKIKIDKINNFKSSIDDLIIDNNSKKDIINEDEKKTIKRKEKSEIINTEPVNLNLNKNIQEKRFSDTKKGICFFVKKNNLNVKNIRNIYLKEKTENNNININNRIKTLDNNLPDNHPLSTANEALPKIRKFGINQMQI